MILIYICFSKIVTGDSVDSRDFYPSSFERSSSYDDYPTNNYRFNFNNYKFKSLFKFIKLNLLLTIHTIYL